MGYLKKKMLWENSADHVFVKRMCSKLLLRRKKEGKNPASLLLTVAEALALFFLTFSFSFGALSH